MYIEAKHSTTHCFYIHAHCKSVKLHMGDQCLVIPDHYIRDSHCGAGLRQSCSYFPVAQARGHLLNMGINDVKIS